MYYNISMFNRHESRQKLIFVLYQHLLLHKDIDVCFVDNFTDEDDEFSFNIIEDIKINKDNYIDEISKYLNKWSFDRLNLIEQAILLESVSEYKLALNDKAVIINEAVIFAKEYCDDESYKYINGVLDNIC